MTDNEKIHQILEYISKNYNHGIIDTDEISRNLNLELSETNQLVREIIKNGDAKDGRSDKTIIKKGAISILQTVATNDAYETKKYLKITEQESYNFNIKASNVQVGNNYGNYTQSSNESKIKGNANTVIQGNKKSKLSLGESKEKSKINYSLIGILLTVISIIIALVVGWDEFLNFFK